MRRLQQGRPGPCFEAQASTPGARSGRSGRLRQRAQGRVRRPACGWSSALPGLLCRLDAARGGCLSLSASGCCLHLASSKLAEGPVPSLKWLARPRPLCALPQEQDPLCPAPMSLQTASSTLLTMGPRLWRCGWGMIGWGLGWDGLRRCGGGGGGVGWAEVCQLLGQLLPAHALPWLAQPEGCCPPAPAAHFPKPARTGQPHM